MIRHILLVISAGILLYGCIDLPQSKYTIVAPTQGSFAGIENVSGTLPPSPQLPPLPEQLVIAYSSASSNINVQLNGNPLKLTYGPAEATIDFSELQNFLREGENQIVVDPLGFGPQLTFFYDSSAPQLVIKNIEKNNGDISISGTLRDISEPTTATLYTFDYKLEGDVLVAIDSQGNPLPTNVDGEIIDDNLNNIAAIDFGAGFLQVVDLNPDANNNFSITLPEAPAYQFILEDENGYRDEVLYLAENQRINPVFKFRLNESFLEQVIPIANDVADGAQLHDEAFLRFRGRDSRVDELEALGSEDSGIFNSINNNHTAILTDTLLGAAEANADNCHETPIALSCNAVQYFTTSGNTEFTTRGGNADALGDRWICTDWSVQLSPDAGQQDPNREQTCSYVEIYNLKAEDVTLSNLSLSRTANSVLDLDVSLSNDDEIQGPALDVNIGIYNWSCGPQTVVHGESSFFGCGGLFGNGACSNTTGIYSEISDPNLAQSEVLELFAQSPDYWCRSTGPTTSFGLVALDSITITDNGTSPSGKILAQISDGELELALGADGSNFELGLTNDVDIRGIDVFGLDLSAIINALAGVLEPLFVTITEGVLQNSLTDFDLSAEFEPENQELPGKFLVETQAWQVNTVCTQQDGQQVICGEQDTIGQTNAETVSADWQWYYRGQVDVLEIDPGVAPSLGFLYVEETVLQPIDNPGQDDNISLVLNSNIINQALNALYSTGFTHFNFLNGEVVTGSLSTDLLGEEGDRRTRLVPSAPATFIIAGSDELLASIEYNGASLFVDTKQDDGTWENNLQLEVDINFGVSLMKVNVDGKEVLRFMTDASPTIEVIQVIAENIPSLEFGSGGFNLSIGFTDNAAAQAIDAAIFVLENFIFSTVSEQFFDLDISQLELPAELPDETKRLELSTEGIEANNGKHLSFSSGLNIVDKE